MTSKQRANLEVLNESWPINDDVRQRLDKFRDDGLDHLDYLTEDGYIICPLCDGKKISPGCIELILREGGEDVTVENVIQCDMGFCECCGRQGKIDWVSWLMGDRFNLDTFYVTQPICDDIQLLNNYICYKRLFEDDMLTDPYGYDEDMTMREAFAHCINNGSCGFSSSPYLKQIKLYKNILLDEDLGLADMDVSELFQTYVWKCVMFTIVSEIIMPMSRNFDSFKLVPTSDIDDARKLLNFCGYKIKDKESVCDAVYELLDDIDDYDCIFDDLDDTVFNAMRRTETSDRRISTPEQLEAMGILLC
jgi:hypothetical protein